jgi:hypothetical protein
MDDRTGTHPEEAAPVPPVQTLIPTDQKDLEMRYPDLSVLKGRRIVVTELPNGWRQYS